ncbi:MAG TPA: hypothetical protein VFG42_09040 [Baekduia sp.]|uniref:hypothetical protein n=1 Tax=Baekduia sp. TaxID=2600305 RepID=UPI002D76D127|nr:hypothetical protein [Baekduia sp.]HET6506922.1 hypothetical protein [Baekduia sp.]
MDPRFEKDLPREPREETVATRRFAAIAAEQDATYPMLAPAMATHMDAEEVFDEEILAGLVNM